MLRDQDFGIVRARAFGTYDFRVTDPKLFLKEVAGSDHNFRLDEFADTMRSRIVSIFSDALATCEGAGARRGDALQRARRGAAAADQPDHLGEVRHRDRAASSSRTCRCRRRSRRRSTSARAWRRRQSQRLRQVPDGEGHRDAGGAGGAGMATELAVGFAIAQQMMQQGFGGGPPTPPCRVVPLRPGAAAMRRPQPRPADGRPARRGRRRQGARCVRR